MQDLSESTVKAATEPRYGTTIVFEGGTTYSWDPDASRYLLTKRALVQDDGTVVLKRAPAKSVKSAKKAAKKAMTKEANAELFKRAAMGDPRAQRDLRELVTQTVSKSRNKAIRKGAYYGPISDETILAAGVARDTRTAGRTDLTKVAAAGVEPTGGDGRDLAAKQVYADTVKGAYSGRPQSNGGFRAGDDQVGLGLNPPPRGAGIRGFPTRAGTATVRPFMVRPGAVSGPTGMPMPTQSGAVDNTDNLANIYVRRFPQDAKGIDTNSVDPVARARQENRDGGRPAGAFADFQSNGVEPIQLDPLTFQPIFNPNIAGAETPTGAARDTQGGDLGSRSGSNRKKNKYTAPIDQLSGQPVGVKQPQPFKAAKADLTKAEKRHRKMLRKAAKQAEKADPNYVQKRAAKRAAKLQAKAAKLAQKAARLR